MTKIDLDFLYEPNVDFSKDRHDLLTELAQYLADRKPVPSLLADWFCDQLKRNEITIKSKRGRKSDDSSALKGTAIESLKAHIEQGMPVREAIKRVSGDLSLKASRETVYQWLRSIREDEAEQRASLNELYREKAIEHFRALAKRGITGPQALDLEHWGPERGLYGSKEYMDELQFLAEYDLPK